MVYRYAMTLIELIFAIIIVAVTIMTIPSMMSIAAQVTKSEVVDEDVLKRAASELVKISQARWDERYIDPLNPTEAQYDVLQISGECSSGKRKNPNSDMLCSSLSPSTIPSNGDGNLSKGIEQLNGINDTLNVNTTTAYTVPISYSVGYVNSAMTLIGTTGTATWQLSSSLTPNAGFVGGLTHQKAVVAHIVDTSSNRNVDIIFTFFKSNNGKFAE